MYTRRFEQNIFERGKEGQGIRKQQNSTTTTAKPTRTARQQEDSAKGATGSEAKARTHTTEPHRVGEVARWPATLAVGCSYH